MDKDNSLKDEYHEREAEKYQHPIPSREFILKHLENRGRPATRHQLIEELKLFTAEEQEGLRRRLIAMVRDGQLLCNRRNAYGPLSKMELIVGRVLSHKEGYGFVVPDEGGHDLFLSAREMRTVFHGDKVLARVSRVDYRGRCDATIVKIVERHLHELVGRFHIASGAAFVEPANHRINQDILIPPHHQGDAKPGEMVVVEITDYPTTRSQAVGKIIEVLGEHMAPGMEVDVAIRNHEIPYRWPEAVLKDISLLPTEVSEEACAGRTDLRALPFVTIDGEDAKDFDDAVYCTPRPRGGWTLYVAIADVSYYVLPNTPLDQAAYLRGNSVYFAGRVIPMLPEILSNELCSLKPNVDRLVMVAEMNINSQGKLIHYQFYEAIIHSQARLTYTQVYAALQGDQENACAYHLLPHLQQLHELYVVLRRAREARGAIDFDLPETKIIFGPGRKIAAIVPLIRNEAHKMIEECMLCANIAAACFLIEHKIPGLFRVHEGPSEEKLIELRRFLGELGLKLPGRKQPSPRDYSALLAQVSDRVDAHVIQTMLLRSLSQAIYSPENKGHFGLAYDAYSHFTSPIRRYPDLLVHRAIRHGLKQRKKTLYNEILWEKYGVHCSMTERRADEATREAMVWLKCEYMLDKVGEEFSGVISSVTSFGFFVELIDIYIEGLVHISLLPNDYYRFDPIKLALRGEQSGQQYSLGDKVNVRVAQVNLDEQKIDFVLVSGMPRRTMQKKKITKRRNKKKR